MADTKTDLDVSGYLASQQSEVQGRRNKSKTLLNQPGETGTIVTKMFTVKGRGIGFEMTQIGSPDATLTGQRPPRPDGIIQDKDKKEES
jgi:hypothetical protein